ncbi:heterokaryon incompatibility protein-domain-containing protein [Pseudomassariella vexata]|uniref:Heterokaryon incompatibility protein-domain-containing protein n=1 Tax=Pseudomassariella vexata TaxID=1141098 RepID=A0A1Y2DNS1_9PEZI|nr:heterokaryon incompatibility protein-domain-containing protein [Pseudomassariella vexata]ORY60938.1 heterokaryon incompatibility protein-domain-containing protein [Pseudomassariella vexata]
MANKTPLGSIAEGSGVVGLSAADIGIQDDPLCAYNISRILQWTDVCEEHHDVCNHPLPGQQIRCLAPKRLVYVGLTGQSHVRLITLDGTSCKYVALSYCWGRKHTGMITTDDSLGQMQDGVELALFSRTIQDAVTVVRALHVQYLWVNALCIIQQQPGGEDWKEESQKMGQIYGDAYLTIAATSASDSVDGFLHRPNGGVAVDFKSRRDASGQGKIYFEENIHIFEAFAEGVENSPLLKRDWVKQERILSRRTIDFSARQIYWSCRMSRISEAGERDDEGGIEAASLMHSMRLWDIIPRLHGNQRAKMEGLFFKAWGNLIGIATILGNVVGCRYFAGVWERNLADGLIWEPLDYPVILTGQQFSSYLVLGFCSGRNFSRWSRTRNCANTFPRHGHRTRLTSLRTSSPMQGRC